MSTYFRVISLETGEQIVHTAGSAFFTFHHISSTQTEDNRKTIIVDICGFDDPRLINELFLDKLRENIFPLDTGYLQSLELDLDANTCMERNANAREPKESHCYSHVHSLIPILFELPRISPKFIDYNADEWLTTNDRFIHINENISERAKDYNRRMINYVKIYFPSDTDYLRSFEQDLDANTCMEQNANAREPKESHCYSHVHSLVPVLFELPRISPKLIDKERCTIRQDPVIDSVILKAYENLPKIALDYGLERELAVPRTVIVSDPSSGKSMLVQMFLRFPCAFSHANVGTRCPVKYILRYDLNLPGGEIRFIEPKHWQAKDLCKKLELEMKRIEKTHRHEGSFRLELFTVEIASKHYTDFEILDVPALVRGDLDANKRAAVERITKHYVCDPSFMIVQQLKEAQQLADNTYGTRRIGEFCINKPALDGSKFPSRKNYAQHTVTIQTKNHHSKCGVVTFSSRNMFYHAK
ncbi:unnamed protein product [Rotaria sordida]|uniref:Uncharacterized protein n=1 Tax=Rotaria sordida TaxID=392033 RepID=A0A815LEG7_9BILA|nr:unnamed protein product [Rotaria sordida]